ncbi:MAG: hypothetical protein LBH68_00355 [Bifidobacteriaceae bacterium]|nr:hypothetical protein [Bifidobacteriaceae bacterium]
MRCVAVPIRIHGILVGAVGVTGPVSRLPLTRLRELGTQLKRELANL